MNDNLLEQLANVFDTAKIPGEHIKKAELWETDVDLLMKVIACNIRSLKSSKPYTWINNNMIASSSDQVAIRLAEIFNLDPDQIISLDFSCSAEENHIFSITVKLVPTYEQTEKLISMLNTHD